MQATYAIQTILRRVPRWGVEAKVKESHQSLHFSLCTHIYVFSQVFWHTREHGRSRSTAGVTRWSPTARGRIMPEREEPEFRGPDKDGDVQGRDVEGSSEIAGVENAYVGSWGASVPIRNVSLFLIVCIIFFKNFVFFYNYLYIFLCWKFHSFK